MRKFALVLSVIAISQLSGCVVHRQYVRDVRYDPVATAGYPTQYPSQYPDQYSQQYSNQNVDQGAYPTQASSQNYSTQGAYAVPASEVAQVINIRTIGEVRNTSNGGGAVVGAIIGGILGNKIGKGDDHERGRERGRGYGHEYRGGDDGAGRAAATVGGAIIGGLIGNEVDRSANETQVQFTEVSLRFNNGQVQNIRLNSPMQLRIGDRVRVSYQAGRWVIL